MKSIEETKDCLFLIPGPIAYDLIGAIEENLSDKEQQKFADLLGFSLALATKCIHKEKYELIMQEFSSMDRILLKIDELKKNGEK